MKYYQSLFAKVFFLKSDAELLTKLESSVCSAVRYTYTAVRLSEEYQRRMKPDENLPTKLGAILTISTGLQNTVSGIEKISMYPRLFAVEKFAKY